MEFYFIIFVLLLISSVLEYFNLRKKDANIIYIIYCFSFFVLSFIRWELSGAGDWGNYLHYFTAVQWMNTSGSEVFEWGFTFINYIISLFTDNYTILLFCTSCILYWFQSKAIFKLSPLPIVSLFVLWSIQFANIHYVRQWVAIAILLYSIQFLIQRKGWKFLILVILAAGFHRTAWMFLPAWWLWKIEWKFKTMTIILGSSIFLSTFLMSIMESLGPMVGGVLQAKIAQYTNDTYNEAQAESVNMVGIIVRGIPNKLLVFFGAIWALGKFKSSHPQLRGFINLYWLGAIMYFMFLPVSLALVRFSYPFDIVQIILIPFILIAFNRNSNKLIVLFILSLYLGLRMWQALNGDAAEVYVPFTTIFDL